MIDPKELIRKFSVEDLCSKAEDYYMAITDPTPQLSKPFSSVIESTELLTNIGLLLSGLRLGKTMTVLEFGAGTCWFSRFLNQLQCQTISCDTSKTALKMGKQLFEMYPIIGKYLSEPQFMHFDGHKINLPDNSVDRLVCIDTFHHIPNQEQVLYEFARVLKEGGIAGFSEPGIYHSQSPQSQYEMANYNVLENDIDVNEIYSIAMKVGFSDFSCKLICDKELSLSEYNSTINFTNKTTGTMLNNIRNIKNTMNNKSIFFLYKGVYIPDSRNHLGLSHSMQIDNNNYSIGLNENLEVSLTITNTGNAKWLCSNINDIGIVKLGVHLYDAENRLIDLDFYKSTLDHMVAPQKTVIKSVIIKFDKPGKYKLAFDLVSESICWFENIGSKPLYVDVLVQ